LIYATTRYIYFQDGDAFVVREDGVVGETLSPLLAVLGLAAEPEEIGVLRLVYYIVE
jgi:hypothetical protein